MRRIALDWALSRRQKVDFGAPAQTWEQCCKEGQFLTQPYCNFLALESPLPARICAYDSTYVKRSKRSPDWKRCETVENLAKCVGWGCNELK